MCGPKIRSVQKQRTDFGHFDLNQDLKLGSVFFFQKRATFFIVIDEVISLNLRTNYKAGLKEGID